MDVNPLPDVSLANMLSYLVGCIFTLLIVSFAVQKLFSPMKFETLGLKAKKTITKMNVRDFLAYVFFWEFYVFEFYI